MSSHHIVREKQEPALLVLGMDNFSDELLGQLLEWSPTVIATEIMAEKLNANGIKIDCVIVDFNCSGKNSKYFIS
jgi:thiamine pyrophosphokinase